MLRKRNFTVVKVRNHYEELRIVHENEKTIMRHLNVFSLMARRSALGPELTRQHIVNKLAFAHPYVYWNWSKILLTYEFRYCLRTLDCRQNV